MCLSVFLSCLVVLEGSESEILLSGTNSFLKIESIHKSICKYFFMPSEIMPTFMGAGEEQNKAAQTESKRT